jgi:hypothetical protein
LKVSGISSPTVDRPRQPTLIGRKLGTATNFYPPSHRLGIKMPVKTTYVPSPVIAPSKNLLAKDYEVGHLAKDIETGTIFFRGDDLNGYPFWIAIHCPLQKTNDPNICKTSKFILGRSRIKLFNAESLNKNDTIILEVY